MLLDKLKYGAINNKKIIFFLIGLGIIAIIFGSCFLIYISKTDQNSVKEYITSFITSFDNYDYKTNLNTIIINNFSYILIVWLLGISIVGTIFSCFLYFSKFFTLSFSIVSMIYTYKLKGLLFALIYVIPCHLVNIIIYILITLYSIKMSNNLIYAIFKKKDVNFKQIINKYLLVLGICLIIILLTSLYESFVIPLIFKKLQFLIK